MEETSNGIKAFEKLGLTYYESAALSALFSAQDITVMQVAQISGIPQTKLYEVLSRLEKNGLIVGSLERPKRYSPARPDFIIDKLVKKKQEETKLFEDLAENNIDFLNDLYSKCKSGEYFELANFLPNGGAVLQKLKMEILSSEKEILCAGGQEILDFEKEINSECRAITRNHCIAGGKINAKYDRRLNYEFWVFDSKLIVLPFRDLRTQKIISGIVLSEEKIVKGTIDYFNSLWQGAQEVEPVKVV